MTIKFSFLLRFVRVCFALLVSSSSANANDNCTHYQHVMNNLGVSMSRYRLIVSSLEDPKAQEFASAELSRHTNEYRRIKRQFNQERCGGGWSRD